MTDTAHPAVCQNCHTILAGHYCHHCGQHAHNPLKSFVHAVEDVFESFWHLDGRIFRTLRELWIPGRIARNYLDGQRVRYLPPLRLFVIMSVFAFFVARLSVSNDVDLIKVNTTDTSFAALNDIAAVERHRDELLADFPMSDTYGTANSAAMELGRESIQQAAARRIAQLENKQPSDAAPVSIHLQLGNDGRSWHPTDNPVAVSWLPDWANDTINQRLQRLQDNLKPGQDHIRYLIEKFVAALPTALFVMMPLLALVLRLIYLHRPLGYLEHLVVALYSHAWLLTALLLGSGLNTVAAVVGASWLGTVSGLVSTLLWLAIPVYLWQMQRVVYGGRWVPHTLRFVTTACIYGVLVMTVTVYAMAVSLTT